MKNIYKAPEAIEIVLEIQDFITSSSNIEKGESGNGEIIEW